MFRTISFLTSLLLWLGALPALAACDPAISLEVSRPFTMEAEPTVVAAKAVSGCPVTLMRVYVDYKKVYEQHGLATINARLVLGAGTHRVVVQAWNSAGALARDERFTQSSADPVEPIAGCDYAGTGVMWGGDHLPYATSSPVRAGMGARSGSGGQITSMRLYIDGVNRVQLYGTTAYCLPAAYIEMKPGYHFLNLEAWDSNGTIYLTGSIVQVK